MDIGIDLDGCGYDQVEALRRWMKQILPSQHPAQVKLSTMGRNDPTTPWHFYETWGFSWEQIKPFWAAGVDAGVIWRSGAPIEGFREVMTRLEAAGHKRHVVTDRSIGKNCETATVTWLETYKIPYDTLTFTADKTSVPVDVFIEDRDKNFLALNQAGTPCFLMDRPWNRHIDAGDLRVNNWYEFYHQIQLMRVLGGVV